MLTPYDPYAYAGSAHGMGQDWERSMGASGCAVVG